jgi:outer membrane protein assembly factor BamB
MHLGLCAVVLLGGATVGLAADWPNWRGPSHNGVSAESGWSVNWPPEGPKQLWRASIGTGFASIVVSQGRAFAMGNRDETDTVFCFDAATGRLIWEHSYPCRLFAVRHEGGPAAAPTVDGERVYTLSREGHVFCLEAATGRLLWKRELKSDPGIDPPAYGYSGAPLVQGRMLVLNAGPAGLALDKMTGAVLWHTGTAPGGYAAPVAHSFQGRRSLAIYGPREILGVNLADGQVLWRHPWRTQFDLNIADPVVADGDRLFVSAGYNHGGAMLQLRAPNPSVVWENKNLRNHFSSSVRWQGHLYGFDGNTHKLSDCSLKCLDERNGAQKWSALPGRLGALIIADGKLIVITHSGELIVATASPDGFEPLARAQVLGDKCWTPPTLANGRLYLRNARGDLVCLDLRKP